MKFDFKQLLTKLQTVPLSEKIFFADHLRVMVKAGLSLSVALETLAAETKNKKFAGILKNLAEAVNRGEQFASSLDKHERVFNTFFRNMIRVGEISGTLEQNLEQISIQMHKDHALLSKIRGAMLYPAVILVATAFIIIGMLTFVIPNVISTFEGIGASLPLPTRVLIAVSQFLTENGIFAALGFVIATVGLVALAKTHGQKVWHKILLKLFIIGPIVQKVNLARFSRTLSALLKTDIPIVNGLEVTAEVLSNLHYKNAMKQGSEALKKGLPLSDVLKQNLKLFPPLVITMTSVGEKSGTTDEMLGEIAEFYEEQVDQITKNLSNIIEPILILFLGVVVGGIALAVISPIYSLAQQL